MYKVTQNAYKLYYKTRTLPAPESVKRAKQLINDKIHPSLLKHIDDKTKVRESFLSSLKNYRPSQTIFEMDINRKTTTTTTMQKKDKCMKKLFKKQERRNYEKC